MMTFAEFRKSVALCLRNHRASGADNKAARKAALDHAAFIYCLVLPNERPF